MNAFVASLVGTPRDPAIDYLSLERLDMHWSRIRCATPPSLLYAIPPMVSAPSLLYAIPPMVSAPSLLYAPLAYSPRAYVLNNTLIAC